MAIENIGNPEEMRIQDISEVKQNKSELFFDPEKKIERKIMEGIKEIIDVYRKTALENDRGIPYFLSLQEKAEEILPEDLKEAIKLDSSKIARLAAPLLDIEYLRSLRPMQMLDGMRSAKVLFPEKVKNGFPVVVNQNLVFSAMADGGTEAIIDALILDPDFNFDLEQNAKNVVNATVKKFEIGSVERITALGQIRLTSPEIFQDIRISDDDWSEMINSANSDIPGALNKIYWLKVIAAKEAKITEQGIKIVPNEVSLEQNQEPMPVEKRY